MTTRLRRNVICGLFVLALAVLLPSVADGQSRGRGQANRDAAVTANVVSASVGGVSLSLDLQTRIRDFYSTRPATNAEALPPGIRRNLARGKPLPPGIARKSAPAELVTTLPLHEGYELVEVGLDVFLVEVATNVIHDVLMDIVR